MGESPWTRETGGGSPRGGQGHRQRGPPPPPGPAAAGRSAARTRPPAWPPTAAAGRPTAPRCANGPGWRRSSDPQGVHNTHLRHGPPKTRVSEIAPKSFWVSHQTHHQVKGSGPCAGPTDPTTPPPEEAPGRQPVPNSNNGLVAGWWQARELPYSNIRYSLGLGYSRCLGIIAFSWGRPFVFCEQHLSCHGVGQFQ